MKDFGSRCLVLCLLISFFCASALAQYTDPVAINDLGGPQEFARRRQELAKQLKTGRLILFARTVLPEANHYREDNDFFYFTGHVDNLIDGVGELVFGIQLGIGTVEIGSHRYDYGENFSFTTKKLYAIVTT